MKVRLEIEFEMENNNYEDTPIKTPQELLDGLSLYDSNVVDGFVLTTHFKDALSTSDFYIHSSSASIVSAKRIDEPEELTEKSIVIGDLLIEDDGKSVTSVINTYFDVEKKFALDLSDESIWLNMYAKYTPETNELSCVYYVEGDKFSSAAIQYIPTDTEKNTIITMMEAFCQRNYNSSISDMLDEFNSDQNEDGGMTL